MDGDRLNLASAKEASHDEIQSRYTERERTTMRETVSYIADVKEAFLDEPAKFDEFFKLMKDVFDHKIDEALGSARMAEIMKGHSTLLFGLRVLFPKSKQNAECDNTKNKSADAEYSMNKHKKTNHVFREAMERIEEGKKLVKKEHKVGDRTIRSEASSSRTIPPKAEVTVPPKAKVTIPPKANRTIPNEASRNIPPKANNTIPSEASRTIPFKVKESIPPKASRTIPPKADNTIPSEASRAIPPKASRTTTPKVNKTIPLETKRNRTIASEVKKTIPPKAMRTALPADQLPFFIPKAKRTIPPEEEHGVGAESSNNKKQRAASFMENLEARFQGDGSHVINSFLEISKTYNEGNKSKDEVY